MKAGPPLRDWVVLGVIVILSKVVGGYFNSHDDLIAFISGVFFTGICLIITEKWGSKWE